jgi:hypothetical protein
MIAAVQVSCAATTFASGNTSAATVMSTATTTATRKAARAASESFVINDTVQVLFLNKIKSEKNAYIQDKSLFAA